MTDAGQNPMMVRKKFAIPPVKVACLAWYVLYDCFVKSSLLLFLTPC